MRGDRTTRPWIGMLSGLLAWLAMSAAFAQDCARPAVEPRVILALYDGTREATPRDSRIHRYLEFPLNYLGFTLQYVDASGRLPVAVLPRDVAGTVTWFDGPVAEEAGFFDWASRVRVACNGPFRQIAFGDPGLPIGAAATPAQEAYLARLGIRLSGGDRIVGALASVTLIDRAMIGHEADFAVMPGRYRTFRIMSGGRSFLRLRTSAEAAAPETDLALVGPQGGYVHQSAAVTFDPRLNGAFWIIDPFAFLDAVLGRGQVPVPDVTTLVGRRVYFGTVSSEGWLSPMPARQFDDEPKLGAEMLLENLIRPYSDLPVTVAVLTGDLDPETGGRAAPRGLAVAQAVFALPQVRAATTGASYVRRWEYFARYDPDLEDRMIDQLREGSVTDDQSGGLVTAAMRGLAGAFSETGGIASGRIADAPRDYARNAFSLSDEIPAALRAVADLGPPDRKPPIFLWPGDARPFDGAVAAARSAGAAAIGGGGGLYNTFSPALAGLSPLSVSVGDDLQVYNALSGDEAYTNYWTAPSHGFHAMADTLLWTDRPRRLKPFHLAFSAQSALGLGTRKAVAALLDRARTAEVVPIEAADYVRMVEGFVSFRAERVGPLTWRMQTRRGLSTVRFDRAGNLELDLAASPGALGARRKGDVLYVSLAPAAAHPVVRLVPGSDPTGMVRGGPIVGVSDSRFPVLDLRRQGCQTHMLVQGGAAGPMTLFGPPDAAAGVVFAVGETAQPVAAEVLTGPDGRIDLRLPDSAGKTVGITLSIGC